MKIKAVAISGSPVKNGNVETFLKTMVDSVDNSELEAEIVYLSRVDIKECKHCKTCTTCKTCTKCKNCGKHRNVLKRVKQCVNTSKSVKV